MTAPSFVLLNRTLTPSHEASIPPADRGFLLGDGLFETMRVANGAVPLLTRHHQRLTHGCALLRLPAPSLSALEEDCTTLLNACALRDGSLRFTLSRGPGPRGLAPPHAPQPTQLLTAAPAPHTQPPPINVHISRHRRDERSVLCSIKSLNALQAILARLEAREQGADDALMLNYRGHIAEASASTFLAHDGHTFLTPPLHDGVLPGISRARLLDAGLCHERTLTPQDIPTFTGAWLVTALSLTPIQRLDGASLPINTEETHALRAFLYAHEP